jgi:hypothetical protein
MDPLGWELIRPFRNGRLDLHELSAPPPKDVAASFLAPAPAPPLSLRVLLSAITDIWTCAICGGGCEPGLGIAKSQLSE